MASTTRPPGIIEPGTLYTLGELGQRCGFGSYCLRKLRRRGLPVLCIGRRRFVRGSQFIAFVLEATESERDADAMP